MRFYFNLPDLSFLKGGFIRGVAILTLGTAFAKVITIAVSPLLTRIYTPEQFGILGLFLALASILTPLSTGRYEQALLAPKNTHEANEILSLSLNISFILPTLLLIVTLAFYDEFLLFFNAEALGSYLLLLPITYLTFGILASYQHLANRRGEYNLISKSNIIQSLSTAVVMIVLGILGGTTFGLIFGTITGGVVSCIFVCAFYFKYFPLHQCLNISREKILIARKYADFPIYNAVPSLLNTASLSIPALFISKYFEKDVLGLYLLVMGVVQAPLAVVSSSVAQINLKKVSDLVNTNGNVRLFLSKLTISLLLGFGLPVILVYTFADVFFITIFGPQWGGAAVIMKILAPAMVLQYTASVIATSLAATRNNKIGAAWKVVSFTATFIVFSFLSPISDIVLLLTMAAICDTILYIIYLYIALHFSSAPKINKISINKLVGIYKQY